MSEETKNTEFPEKTHNEVDPISLEIEDPEALTPRQKALRLTIDDILEETEHGTRISIHRVKPAWDQGWLDTVEWNPDDENNFSLSYLKETWGGELFTLKFREKGKILHTKAVRIAGPPRRDGILVEHPDLVLERKKREELMFRPQASDSSKLLETLLPLMMQQNGNRDTAQLKMMLETIRAAKPSSKMSEMRDMVEMMDLLKGIQGEDKGGGGDDMSTMLSGFVELLKAKGAAEVGKPAPVYGPPKGSAPMYGPPPSRPPLNQLPLKPNVNIPSKDVSHVAPVPPNLQTPLETAGPVSTPPSIDPVIEEEDISLGEELASLEVDEINDVLNEAFEKLSPEKKQKIIAGLATMDLGKMSEVKDGSG